MQIEFVSSVRGTDHCHHQTTLYNLMPLSSLSCTKTGNSGMSSKKKIEQNAVNEVRDFIDSTSCLRSYLEENDKTPLWDGSVFVYKGEPDKNENLIGTLRTQIKGTEVTQFGNEEKHRISVTEINLYMREGGLFFFVVEMLMHNIRERRIFYRQLMPHYLQALLSRNPGSKSIEISLTPLPTDYHIVEDEMINFILNARKQVSFVGKPGLSFSEAMNGTYQLKASGYVSTANNHSLPMLLTSQPFVLYQERPFSSIPIQDVEISAVVKETVHDSVGIGGEIYFPDYVRTYNHKTITINIGDCFIVNVPKNGYENSIKTKMEIKFPKKGDIKSATNALEFLMALKDATTITFGKTTTPLFFEEEIRGMLFKDVARTYQLYKDIDALWQELQIPGVFSFDDFDEVGLNQYLDIVLHVHRKVNGAPKNIVNGQNSFYSVVCAGNLHILIHFTHVCGDKYASVDAFNTPYIYEKGLRYPILSAALANCPTFMLDNVHYAEQLECYRNCLINDTSFMKVIENDVSVLQKIVSSLGVSEKRRQAVSFIESLQQLVP